MTRARFGLRAGKGASNSNIAAELGLTRPTVGIWRQRYLRQDLQGLYDELGPAGLAGSGMNRSRCSCAGRSKPSHGRHALGLPTLAAATRVSKSTVQRVWRAFGLQRHRRSTLKLSTDPFFAEKVRGIVGLYLDPAENALVLCVDEKNQI